MTQFVSFEKLFDLLVFDCVAPSCVFELWVQFCVSHLFRLLVLELCLEGGGIYRKNYFCVCM